MYKTCIFIAILAVFMIFPICTLAVPIGITVSPLKYKLEVDPGEVITDTITVINPNDFELRVKPEFQDFRVTKTNAIQWLPDDIENPYSMQGWIDISREVIILEPKEQRKVSFTITVPADALAGGHYAAIFFTAVTGPGGTVGAIPQVGSLVIMNVSGDVVKTGQFLDFSGPFFVVRGPINFIVTFLNTGTTHYEIKADISINKVLGSKKTISSETKFVYPDIKREIKAQWDKEKLFGIYKATAKIVDGEGNEHTLSKTFIAFPKSGLIGLAILLVILVVLYFLYRRLKKKFKLVRVEG